MILLPERQCKTCTATQQKNFGCEARQKDDGTWENQGIAPLLIDGVEDWRCPRRPIKDDPRFWSEVLMLYRGYAAGFLPDEGNIASQSNRGWTLLSTLDSFISEARSEAFDNASKKSRENRD